MIEGTDTFRPNVLDWKGVTCNLNHTAVGMEQPLIEGVIWPNPVPLFVVLLPPPLRLVGGALFDSLQRTCAGATKVAAVAHAARAPVCKLCARFRNSRTGSSGTTTATTPTLLFESSWFG